MFRVIVKVQFFPFSSNTTCRPSPCEETWWGCNGIIKSSQKSNQSPIIERKTQGRIHIIICTRLIHAFVVLVFSSFNSLWQSASYMITWLSLHSRIRWTHLLLWALSTRQVWSIHVSSMYLYLHALSDCSNQCDLIFVEFVWTFRWPQGSYVALFRAFWCQSK